MWYDEHLGEHTIPRPEGSVVWVYDFIVGKEVQNRMVDELPGARHFFAPMSAQPFYNGPEKKNIAAGKNDRQKKRYRSVSDRVRQRARRTDHQRRCSQGGSTEKRPGCVDT